MGAQVKETGTITQPKPTVGPHIQKGPVEGIIIVNGRPQTERADMPTISFESIEAIMRLNKGK